MFYRGDLIIRQMDDTGMTVQKLAASTGVCCDTIVRARQGKNISVKNLVKIAKALSIENLHVYDGNFRLVMEVVK